jgi:hypothetical protein
MGVTQRPVPMPVAVRADGHRVVIVSVVPVVVSMRVFVLDRIVFVIVSVRFRQMQQDACEHQQAAQQHHAAERTVAEADRQCGADEGGEGEHRACARSPESALREQIEA